MRGGVLGLLKSPMQYLPPSSFGFDAGAAGSGRAAQARLVAELAGGRTILRRQHVGYPSHVTRGFYLDQARPDLLTLYLQSASGGLYAGDRIALDVDVGACAAFHLTTQASTVVHDGRGIGSMLRQRINVGAGGFCAITNDPCILFPGAHLDLATTAVVAEDAILLLADGFAVHDPGNAGRSFAQFANSLRIMRPDGRVLLLDRGNIQGDELCRGALGTMAAAASVTMIAPSDKWPAVTALQEAADRCGCLAGASLAPNDAGICLRLLAPDGGTLTRGLEAAFHVAGQAALGVDLARRRK
jgi:urease accessory protein